MKYRFNNEHPPGAFLLLYTLIPLHMINQEMKSKEGSCLIGSNGKTYSVLKHGLDASSMRQRTISSNIANINTAGYKVNKVEFEEHLKKATEGSGLQKTHEMHFGLDGVEDVQATVEKRESTFYNENGNNVDIDYEMTELAANEIYYSTLIQLLNSKYSKLNSAINK